MHGGRCLAGYDLGWLAERVDTPFYVYDAALPGQNPRHCGPDCRAGLAGAAMP